MPYFSLHCSIQVFVKMNKNPKHDIKGYFFILNINLYEYEHLNSFGSSVPVMSLYKTFEFLIYAVLKPYDCQMMAYFF